MRIIKRQFAFALMAAMGCADHAVLAQVQPLTDFKPIETYNELVSCSEKDCKITTEQFSALCIATKLYKVDMPSVRRTSLQVGINGDLIVVTILPDTGAKPPKFGVPGGEMAITYTFDSSGSHLMKRIYNR
ncbi:MAG: hypothetical protein ACYC0F_13165 [Rhodanobacter sp.]